MNSENKDLEDILEIIKDIADRLNKISDYIDDNLNIISKYRSETEQIKIELGVYEKIIYH